MKNHTPPRGFKEFLADYKQEKEIFAKTNMKENKDNVVENMTDEELELFSARIEKEKERRDIQGIKSLKINGFSTKDIVVKITNEFGPDTESEYSLYLRVNNELFDIYYDQKELDSDDWIEFVPPFFNEDCENCYTSDFDKLTTIKELFALGFEIYE